MTDRLQVDLTGAPQTMLATLYGKALDADLPKSVLHGVVDGSTTFADAVAAGDAQATGDVAATGAILATPSTIRAGAWAPGLDLSFWVARGRARGRAGVSGPGAVGPDERPADGMEGGRRGRRWT